MTNDDFGEPWLIVKSSVGCLGLVDRGGHAPIYADKDYIQCGWGTKNDPLLRIISCVNILAGASSEDLDIISKSTARDRILSAIRDLAEHLRECDEERRNNS